MIIILHRDPLIAAQRYKRRHLKTFIRVYIGYLIQGIDYKYDGQIYLFQAKPKDPYLRWLVEDDNHFQYLMFLTHYLIGQYRKFYPDKPIDPEELGINIILKKTRPIFPKQFSKMKKLPIDEGQTIVKRNEQIEKNRSLYNILVTIK
jgi:hypothetical protein